MGSMSKVAKSFICSGCLNPVTSAGHTSVDIGASAKLELVDKFCYLGDMLCVDGDADAAVEARIRIGWNKFRQLVPLFANKDLKQQEQWQLVGLLLSTLQTGDIDPHSTAVGSMLQAPQQMRVASCREPVKETLQSTKTCWYYLWRTNTKGTVSLSSRFNRWIT